MHPEIDLALQDGGGVVRGRPTWRSALNRAVAAGTLTRLLPGVFCRTEHAGDLSVRLRAVGVLDPNAVLLGRAAAAASWWPGLDVPVVHARRATGGSPTVGYAWHRCRLRPDEVVRSGGLAVTSPARTVLDLIPDLGGRVVDEALRRRAVRLVDLEQVLAQTPDRPGNRDRRRILQDSRDEPWSEAERAFHRLLRDLRLPWRHRTNLRVGHPGGISYLDVALPALRLGFEIDGWAFHGGAQAFAASHERDVNLGLAGWIVHHFAASAVFDRPDWVGDSVRRLCRDRARGLRIG